MTDRKAYFAARYERLKQDPEWVAKRKARRMLHPQKRRQRGITPGKDAIYRLRRKARLQAAAAGIPVLEAYRFLDCVLPKDLET